MKTQPKTCYAAIARLIDENRNRFATAEDLEWEEAIDRGTIPHIRGTENHVCGTESHDCGTENHDCGTKNHDCGTINHSHSKSRKYVTHL